MPTRRKDINNGNIGGDGDFKIQLASDNSGQYVDVVALDAGIGITIGTVNQGAAGTDAWKVDPSGVTSPVSAATLPLPTNAAQESGGNLATLVGEIGTTSDAAATSDTGTASLNSRLQRIAQRLSSLIALVPAALTGSGNFKVALVESTATQTVSGAITANAGINLNTSTLAQESGGNLATLAGAVSAGKVQTTVAASLPAGSNVIGKFGVDQSTPGTTNAVTSSASNIVSGQVSVGAVATLVVAARPGREQVTIIQEGTTLIRVGPSGVTTGTGVPLPGVQYSSITIRGGAAIYGIVSSGSQTISYLESY